MRFILTFVVGLTVLPLAALADSKEDAANCSSNEANRSITGCTNFIAHGASKANLAIAYNNRGWAYINKGDYESAIADYDQAIRLKPDYPEAYNGRGIAHDDKAEYDRAIADYDQAIRLKPDYPEAYNGRGIAHDDKAEYDRAITDYDQAIRLKPKFADAYNNRGNAYESKGDEDRAIADYDQAISLNPNLDFAYGGRGNAHRAKGEYDLAMADYAQAIRLNPDRAAFYVGRGHVYYFKGDFDRGIADEGQALALDPKNALAFNYRGWCYVEKSDYERAIADFSAAIVISPNYAEPYSGRAWAYAQKSELDKALPDSERAVSLNPKEFTFLHVRGWIHSHKGELALALADLDAAIELKNDAAFVYADRGYAHELNGERDAAIADYKKALSLKNIAHYDDRAKEEALQRMTALLAAGAPTAPANEAITLSAAGAMEQQKNEEKATTAAQQTSSAAPTMTGLTPQMPVDQGKRVALVIGNSAYRSVARLDNPANDAKLMAETLRGLSFTLVGDGAQLDLDKTAFDSAIQSFGNQLQGATVGLFYYAGHGLQLRGSNYLVPVNANPTREVDVDFQMVDTAVVLRQMEASGTKLNVVMLDACRNNPFGGRGLRASSGGLAQMQAPEGTLISYATQPGNVAQDGLDGDSPYTKALAETIRKPGLDIFQTFNAVGLVVKRATGGAQQPWVSSSPIEGVFFFKP